MSTRWSSAFIVALISGLMGAAMAARGETTPAASPGALVSGPAEEACWFDSDTQVTGYTKSEKGDFESHGIAVTHFTRENVPANVYPDWCSRTITVDT